MRDRVLVVDDEPGMALGMAEALRRCGHTVDTAPNGEQALVHLARRDYGVVFTDLRMPGIGGRELLQQVHALCPWTRVVVVTAHATVESAVACVRDGAVDYLMKPFSPAALVGAAGRALIGLTGDDDEDEPPDFIAEDPVTLEVLQLAFKAAENDVTVLLEAESGAGKEVFARLIHRESARRHGPFVAVNCAALPRELLEAELFGHCRGAFTGAHRDRKGQFVCADGGTLLLDEIGEMSPELQARLLRVLQNRQVRAVGSDAAQHVDVRVVAATNRNLREEVRSGRFREDLYYRLRVWPIRIPPLRERPGDIEPLAHRFARRFGGARAKLSTAALEALRGHAWPGNVRELQNAIQRAAILAGDEPIDRRHLGLESSPADPGDGRPGGPLSLEDAEREAIRLTLARTRGNRTAAAAALGISPRTLRHKLKQFRDAGNPVPETP